MMKLMMLMCTLLFVAACSDETDKVEQHVWQEQTDMIDSAEDVRGVVVKQASEHRKLIEQHTQ